MTVWNPYAMPPTGYDANAASEIRNAVAAEREACAKIADDEAEEYIDGHDLRSADVARVIAAAIRARTMTGGET